MNFLFVALGGALGSVARYFLSGVGQRWLGTHFPYGTLSVNLIGSLAIGVLWGFFGGQVPSATRALLLAGFLGGFTTFSAFSLETLNLLRTGHLKLAIAYIVISNTAAVALAAVGYYFARMGKV